MAVGYEREGGREPLLPGREIYAGGRHQKFLQYSRGKMVDGRMKRGTLGGGGGGVEVEIAVKWHASAYMAVLRRTTYM